MEVSESNITELFIYLFICMQNAAIFFGRGLRCLVCLLRKLLV